jgi:hypothetical protein
MRGVIDVLVGQIKGDDLVAVGVNADMKFTPGAAFRRSVLLIAIRLRHEASTRCCRRSNAVRLFQNAPGSEPAVHKPGD